MPAIHGSLSNEDFVTAMNISKAKGLPLNEWVTALVQSEIHKLSRDIDDINYAINVKSEARTIKHQGDEQDDTDTGIDREAERTSAGCNEV